MFNSPEARCIAAIAVKILAFLIVIPAIPSLPWILITGLCFYAMKSIIHSATTLDKPYPPFTCGQCNVVCTVQFFSQDNTTILYAVILFVITLISTFIDETAFGNPFMASTFLALIINASTSYIIHTRTMEEIESFYTKVSGVLPVGWIYKYIIAERNRHVTPSPPSASQAARTPTDKKEE